MRTPRLDASRALTLALTALLAACGAQSVRPLDVVSPPRDAVADRPDVPTDVPRIGCSRDAECDDGVFCNGAERCAPGAMGANPITGCLPPGSGSLDCDDGNVCTIDTCSDMTGGCVHSGRDLDGDGHVDAMCGGDDCDDANPNVHPGAMENCTNGLDDDCNGLTDGADPACMPHTGGPCDGTIALPGPGTYMGSTVGMGDLVGDVCPGVIGVDAVSIYTFTLTSTTSVTATLNALDDVSLKLAIATSCTPFAGRVCGTELEPSPTHDPVSINTTLAPGTYWIAVDLQGPENFTLSLAYDTPAIDETYALTTPSLPFVDVCAIPGHGTALAMADDNTVALPNAGDVPPATLPFALRLADVATTPPLSVSTNGWISLLPTSEAPLRAVLPAPDLPNLTIAGLWEDLVLRAPGLCYATVGSAPSRRFIVEWADAALFAMPDAHITFEVAIDEAPAGANNTIEMVYQHVSDTAMPGIGLENSTGTEAVQYTGSVTDGLALRFTPVPR